MRKIKPATILRLIAMVLVIFFTWGAVRDRIDPKNWTLLPQYHGDPMHFLHMMQAGAEGDFVPFWAEGSKRLGAPYTAHWEDYPQPGKFLVFFLGILTRLFGLGFAGNFGQIWLHILDAFAFYYCSRFLKHSKTWAFVGAILFSLTYFNIFNNMAGLHKCSAYMLPFAMLSTWLIFASKRMQMGDRLSWLCLITALIMGVSHPYNLGMYGFFLGFAMLGQWLTVRRKPNLQIGAISFVLVVVGFLALNSVTFVYQWTHGYNAAGLARNYFESELYALKPIEFLIPPADHHIALLAAIGKNYETSAFIKGEIFSPYLGIVCAISLLWVFAEMFYRVIGKKSIIGGDVQPRRFPSFGPQIAWILAYSTIAGINCVLALCGFQLFRATSRYCIFVSLISLMFLVARMTILSRRWTPGLKYTVAAVVLVIGLYDQVPRPEKTETVALRDSEVASDRAFGALMEQKLPAGTMVFELPVYSFPEGLPIHGVDCYDMFRPYLWTKTLRFTYGAMRGRPEQDWQWDVEAMTPPQMIDQLERYGFGAIYLLRKCYADGGESLIKQFAAAGRDQIFEDELHEEVCIVLKPSPHPEMPHTNDRALLSFKDGWVLKEKTHAENRQWSTDQNRQWSSGDAMLSFFSEARDITSYTVHGMVGTISARRVSVVMDGHEVWSSQIPEGQGVQMDFSVNGKHGNNRLYFKTDAPPVQPKESPSPLAFTVVNLTITKQP